MNELVAALRHCAKRSVCNGCPRCGKHITNCPTELYREAADAIEELSREIDIDNAAMTAMDAAMPRWIPVTERLPEKRKWVLCRCQASITDVLRYENAEWYHDPTHVYMFDFVTHWMPLPEPPKEET